MKRVTHTNSTDFPYANCSNTACFTVSGISATSIIPLKSILPVDSACWHLLQFGRKGENAFRINKMLFQMTPRSPFSTEDSVKIVTWWGELKDLDKVCWRYAKEKGIEKFKILSKSSVWRILGQSLNFHPYRINLMTFWSLWMMRW